MKLGGLSQCLYDESISQTIYIGVDVAKKTHFAAALSSDGVVLSELFEICNDFDGFSKRLSNHSLFKKSSLLIIGLESTAHYGNNLVSHLFTNDHIACVINLIQTSVMRKSNISKTKTGKVDAQLIAKTLLMNQFRLVLYEDIE